MWIRTTPGEAEFGGVVKGAAEGLGVRSLAVDVGLQVELAGRADSSSATGICRRSSTGHVCGTWLLAISGSKSVFDRPLSPAQGAAVQVLSVYSAFLDWTSRPVEEAVRHLFPPRSSCFQQVGVSILPSTLKTYKSVLRHVANTSVSVEELHPLVLRRMTRRNVRL